MKALYVGILVVSCLVLALPKAYAQPYYEVYPTQGSANTDIFLQIRGLPGTGFYEYYHLYIFWDDILLGVFPDDSGTYEHFFDTHFSPPNSGDYSALGNHTVYFEVWNANRNAMFINATFEFIIIEYIPCPEYLALNATCHRLLTDCNALNASYQTLLEQYNTLSADYDALLDQYSNLLGNYDDMSGSYDSLSVSYDEMNTTYHELKADYQNLSSTQDQIKDSYDGLTGSYSSLQSIHDSLTSNYTQLQEKYTKLVSSYINLQGNYTQQVSSYNGLQTDNNNLSMDLANYRNLTYVFIITAVVFLATTIYFARRK